jgi:DNA-binding Lrp family transcriptional regulator
MARCAHAKEREADMVHAYILVQTEVGRSSRVASAIAELPGVSVAEDVTGPYDVIARIEASSVDELGRLVIAKIQDVPHITRTTTCTVVHVAP